MNNIITDGINMDAIDSEWIQIIEDEFKKEYFENLALFLKIEYSNYAVYPNHKDIFNAFCFTPMNKVKVVIIGQDPYHNEGQAHGLCFSVKPEAKIPPSLINIYKELKDDLGCYIPNHGNLTKWSHQGVFLINSILTVRAHEANSHSKKGWEKFTDAIIETLNSRDTPIVFILWGKPAQRKKEMLNIEKHLILEAPHPSPLSSFRGFFGSKPFSKTNDFLVLNGISQIDWQIENK